MSEKAKNQARKYKVRANDKFKETAVDCFISNDDDRLPLSLMTLEEFKEAQRISEDCWAGLEIAKENHSPHTYVTNSMHPCHKLYLYIKAIHERFIGTENESKCVICGDNLEVKKNSSFDCYCGFCGRKIPMGIVRSKKNTRGFKNWGKMCTLCGCVPAAHNCRGMCLPCYRSKPKIKTRNVEELEKAKKQKGIMDEIAPLPQKAVSIKTKKWAMIDDAVENK